jgi:hypothetical protein
VSDTSTTIDFEEQLLGRDVWALREALDAFAPKLSTTHFHRFKAHQLINKAPISTSLGCEAQMTPQRLAAAFQLLAALGDYQAAPLTPGGLNDSIYVRKLDSQIRDGRSFPALCNPFHSADVEAICAMVHGKRSGMVELKALKSSNLSTWCRSGFRNRPADRAHLLEVLDWFADAGTTLQADPHSIKEFVAVAQAAHTKRREDAPRIEALGLEEWEKECAERAREARQQREREEWEKQEVERMDREKAMAEATTMKMCERCEKKETRDGRPLCVNCEDEVLRNSGYGKIAASDLIDGKWRSDVEAAVARNVADNLDAKTEDREITIGEIAEQVHVLQRKLVELNLELADAGVYVDGHNIEELEESIRESFAGRAIKASLRRHDGKVLVAGMEFSPDAVRTTADQIDEGTESMARIVDSLLAELHGKLGRDNRKLLRQLQQVARRVGSYTAELAEAFEAESPVEEKKAG